MAKKPIWEEMEERLRLKDRFLAALRSPICVVERVVCAVSIKVVQDISKDMTEVVKKEKREQDDVIVSKLIILRKQGYKDFDDQETSELCEVHCEGRVVKFRRNQDMKDVEKRLLASLCMTSHDAWISVNGRPLVSLQEYDSRIYCRLHVKGKGGKDFYVCQECFGEFVPVSLTDKYCSMCLRTNPLLLSVLGHRRCRDHNKQKMMCLEKCLDCQVVRARSHVYLTRDLMVYLSRHQLYRRGLDVVNSNVVDFVLCDETVDVYVYCGDEIKELSFFDVEMEDTYLDLFERLRYLCEFSVIPYLYGKKTTQEQLGVFQSIEQTGIHLLDYDDVADMSQFKIIANLDHNEWSVWATFNDLGIKFKVNSDVVGDEIDKQMRQHDAINRNSIKDLENTTTTYIGLQIYDMGKWVFETEFVERRLNMSVVVTFNQQFVFSFLSSVLDWCNRKKEKLTLRDGIEENPGPVNYVQLRDRMRKVVNKFVINLQWAKKMNIRSWDLINLELVDLDIMIQQTKKAFRDRKDYQIVNLLLEACERKLLPIIKIISVR